MSEDLLKKYGITPDPEEHPADVAILSKYGIAPDASEHPVNADPYNLGSPEERFRTPAAPPRDRLKEFGDAISPTRVIPAVAADVWGNIRDNALAGASMASRGVQHIAEGQTASGTGEALIGAASVPLSLITGPVKSGENALASITGNPDFADKAALMFPVNTGGPALRTVTHNIHPTTKAADFIAEKVGPDNMPEVLARLRSNPRLRPIDTNDQLRMSGQGLIASPESPAASRTLTESMRTSAAGARDAVKGTYNETMGPPPNLFEEKARLENRAKAIGSSKINPSLVASKPVDTSAVISDIDKALNPAAVKMTPGTTITPTPLQQELISIRQQLASGDKEVLTDAARLHEIQSELRVRADDLLSSATGSDRRLGRELKNYRNKLVDAIDASAPGYKEGLRAYKDEKDVERAYDFGKKSLSTTEEYDPSFVKAWVDSKDRTKEELDAARLGQRYAVERKMGSIKQSGLDPARSGTDVPQIEFNRLNIEHLHGKENTDKMFQHLRDERDIALTNNRGLGNSKTAETQAAERELRPREISQPHSNLPGWALALGAGAGALSSNPTLGAIAGGSLLAARGAKSGYDWLARRGEVSRNQSIADLITRNDPEAIRALSIAAQRVSQRNKLGNLLAPP